MPPQDTVVFAKAVIVGNIAGLTVIIRVTGTRVRPQASMPVHVSVTVPPQTVGIVVKVDVFELPFNKHPPVKPLLYEIVLPVGTPPQATVIFDGAVIIGKLAGFTVIIRVTGNRVRPQASVPVHVSVTVPPQASGIVVKVEVFELPFNKHPPVKPLL